MKKREVNQLVSLLKKLKKEGFGLPNMPLEVFYAISDLVPLAAVEVVVHKDGQILLTERRDEYWDGWHIPGGFIGATESFSDACKRIARKELRVDVKLEKVQEAFAWEGKHPYGSPISIVCICSIEKTPKVGKFFDEKSVPLDLIYPHSLFFKNYFKNVK